MSKLEKMESENENLPAKQQQGFFGEYGDLAAQHSNIVGQLLKFSKGKWVAGANNDKIETGTRMIVDMPTLIVGWQKWQNDRPVDNRMGPIVEGFQPPKRKDYGDNERDEWEKDATGQPRDPWQ
jgi:hypothetical protein